MRKISKTQALNIILQWAGEYDKKLNNRQFLILYTKGNTIDSVIVGFRDFNFLHLTGVKTRLSASLFYSACISGKLSEKDFKLDNAGHAVQKLSVLPYLSGLLYNKCLLGEYINSGIYVRADYFAGSTKNTLSLGFESGKKFDYPVTLYNESIKNLVEHAYKVVAVYSKMTGEADFNTVTFEDKNTAWDALDASGNEIAKDKIQELLRRWFLAFNLLRKS